MKRRADAIANKVIEAEIANEKQFDVETSRGTSQEAVYKTE